VGLTGLTGFAQPMYTPNFLNKDKNRVRNKKEKIAKK
jgi:hypothetical protein